MEKENTLTISGNQIVRAKKVASLEWERRQKDNKSLFAPKQVYFVPLLLSSNYIFWTLKENREIYQQ